MIKEYFLNFHRMHRELHHRPARRLGGLPRRRRPRTGRCTWSTPASNRDRRPGPAAQPWIGSDTFMVTYGDGVADVDMTPAGRVPPGPREARHGDRRPAAVPLRRPRPRRRPRRRVRREAADRRRLDQRRLLRLSPDVLDYIDGRRTLWSAGRSSAWPPTASSWPTATTASAADGHLARREQCSSGSGPGKAPWKVWDMSAVLAGPADPRHRRRPGWSAAGWCAGCVEAGADVVCLRPRLGAAERAGPLRR